MDTAQFLADLRAQRDRIDNAINALESLNGTAVSSAKAATKAVALTVKSAKTAPVATPTASKRVISPEARQRMAEAQQKRWAKKKRAVKAAPRKAVVVAPIVTTSGKIAPVATPAEMRVRKPMSAATKKKLAEAIKASWAKKAAAKKAAMKAVPVTTA
jgi:hypothetical protein